MHTRWQCSCRNAVQHCHKINRKESWQRTPPPGPQRQIVFGPVTLEPPKSISGLKCELRIASLAQASGEDEQFLFPYRRASLNASLNPRLSSFAPAAGLGHVHGLEPGFVLAGKGQRHRWHMCDLTSPSVSQFVSASCTRIFARVPRRRVRVCACHGSHA